MVKLVIVNGLKLKLQYEKCSVEWETQQNT